LRKSATATEKNSSDSANHINDVQEDSPEAGWPWDDNKADYTGGIADFHFY